MPPIMPMMSPPHSHRSRPCRRGPCRHSRRGPCRRRRACRRPCHRPPPCRPPPPPMPPPSIMWPIIGPMVCIIMAKRRLPIFAFIISSIGAICVIMSSPLPPPPPKPANWAFAGIVVSVNSSRSVAAWHTTLSAPVMANSSVRRAAGKAARSGRTGRGWERARGAICEKITQPKYRARAASTAAPASRSAPMRPCARGSSAWRQGRAPSGLPCRGANSCGSTSAIQTKRLRDSRPRQTPVRRLSAASGVRS